MKWNLPSTSKIQVNASINDDHYDIPYSLDIELDAGQDQNDTLGKLGMAMLEIAMFEQTLARNTGQDTPYTLTIAAESNDVDFDEWDTDENPPKPQPRQRKAKTTKPSQPCESGKENHRWMVNPNKTFTCSLCNQTRKVNDLTKTG